MKNFRQRRRSVRRGRTINTRLIAKKTKKGRRGYGPAFARLGGRGKRSEKK